MALLRTSSNCSDDENYATLYDFLEDKSASRLESSQAVLAAEVDTTGARLQVYLLFDSANGISAPGQW